MSNPSEAASLLATSDTTLGIIAALTLAAAKGDAASDDEADNAEAAADATSAGLDGSVATPTQGSDGSDSPTKLRVATKKSGGSGGGGGGASTAFSSVQEQRSVIRRLQEHNQLLRQELSIESRDTRALLAQDKRARMEALQQTATAFAHKVAQQHRKLARVEQLAQQRQNELNTFRQQRLALHGHDVGSSNGLMPAKDMDASGGGGNEPSGAAAARRMRALENRLELSLVKKNELDSVNKHLFALIDKVRRDRVIFDGIYKKLEREASESRARHTLQVTELQRATSARLEVDREVERVQAEAAAEQRGFERQFADLKRELELWMLEHDGSDLGLALPPSSPTAASVASSTAAVDRSVDAADGGGQRKKNALARVAARSSWKIGVDRALVTGSDGLVAKYDAAFETIRGATGIRDMAQLCGELLARDDANFQRFKRVEELSREQVALQAQVAELAAELDAFKAREGIASSAAQKQQVRKTQGRLAAAVGASHELEMETEALQTVFARVKSSVHSVHSMLVHASGAKVSAAAGGGAASSGGVSGAGNAANSSGGGSAAPANGDWFQPADTTALPLSAREVTEANVLEYLRAIETYASRLAVQTPSDDLDEGSSQSIASPSSAVRHGIDPGSSSTSLPLGHGPATLPSDPKHKLQVQVPSFGGLNGVIVLPAESVTPMASVSPSKRMSTQQMQPQQQQMQTQQPQPMRKKPSKFELYPHKSMSQQQFDAALAAASSSDAVAGDAKAVVASHQASEENEDSPAMPAQEQHPDEDDEGERALTYDELKRFAARNLTTRHCDEQLAASPTRNR